MDYTKEPWEVKTATFTEKGVAFEVIMSEQVICAGDAKLIEAAPKLYEACKEVAKAYKSSPTSMQPLFWLRCVQAIAKAEGKINE